MFSRAKAYAEIASRSRPTATDVLAAAEEYDLPISALKEEAREHKKRLRNRMLAGEFPGLLLTCRGTHHFITLFLCHKQAMKYRI